MQRNRKGSVNGRLSDIVRICDFPRLQIAALAAMLVGLAGGGLQVSPFYGNTSLLRRQVEVASQDDDGGRVVRLAEGQLDGMR